ncbi:unnamed protein product [Lota lota]
MERIDELRAMLNRQVTHSNEEIWRYIKQVISDYEGEVSRLKEENSRQRILNAVWSPHVCLNRAEVLQHPACRQPVSPRPAQEEPWTPGIQVKEEQEEQWISREGDGCQETKEEDIAQDLSSAGPVKTEDDEELIPPSLLDQTETEPPTWASEPHIKPEPQPLSGTSDQYEPTEPQPLSRMSDQYEPTEPQPLSGMSDQYEPTEPQPLSGTSDQYEPTEPQPLSGTSDQYEPTEPQPLSGTSDQYEPTEPQPLSGTSDQYEPTEPQPLSGTSDQYEPTEPQPLSGTSDQYEPTEPQAKDEAAGSEAAVGGSCPDRDSEMGIGRAKFLEKLFRCSVCELECVSKAHLRTHARVHTGERPYACPDCGKAFTTKGGANRHIRGIHHGDRPFRCEFCTFSFTFKSGLSRHLRVHTGERPYTCSFCGHRFTQSGNLTTHIDVHHRITSLKCKTNA